MRLWKTPSCNFSDWWERPRTGFRSCKAVLHPERAARQTDANLFGWALFAAIGIVLNRRFDGVIITGTEPKQADLRQEPYWNALAEVMDWAETNTSSTYCPAWQRTPESYTATGLEEILWGTRDLACLSIDALARIR